MGGNHSTLDWSNHFCKPFKWFPPSHSTRGDPDYLLTHLSHYNTSTSLLLFLLSFVLFLSLLFVADFLRDFVGTDLGEQKLSTVVCLCFLAQPGVLFKFSTVFQELLQKPILSLLHHLTDSLYPVPTTQSISAPTNPSTSKQSIRSYSISVP